MRPLAYGRTIAVGQGISVTLSDAGHILGSAHVLAELRENGRTSLFGISGDIGAPGRPVVADPTPFRAVDFLQMEATYGNHDHRPLPESVAELEKILTRATEGDGVVLIPAFSLGRTQDILYLLNGWKEKGKFKDLLVYVDSPLASRLTAVFDQNKAAFDDDAKGLLARGDDPFSFPGLHFVANVEESDRLRREAKRALIIASSGMCQGGRIRGHLETFLPRPTTDVVIVGHQAPGTLGRRLVDGAKTVWIHGHEVPVAAGIHTLGGFSAHAGRKDLLAWFRAIERKPKKAFLVHAEPYSLEALAQGLRDEFHVEVVIPAYGQSFDL
jgi:metallo-beta-lactamase family protein